MADARDPVALTARLIRCPSVTPRAEAALDLVEAELCALGFSCRRLPFGVGEQRVDNLFARLGDRTPHLCFAGHLDVVPTGPEEAWTVPPFGGEVRDGRVWGRGAVDMKGAVACFVAAVARFLDAAGGPPGSISLLLTGDEEGPAVNGTRRVLEWMAAEGHIPDACLVGEPTNPHTVGQTFKIGRRGAMTGRLVVHGTQGHAAYPALADNPIPAMLELLRSLLREPLDRGSADFEPSNLEVTTVDVGNPASNVIPGAIRATFNVRFNDLHTSASLTRWIRRRLDAAGHDYELGIEVSGESFLTERGPWTELLSAAVEEAVGRTPEASTSGGTSDARFVRDYCPVAEFGLVGRTAHMIDEHAAVTDLAALTDVYGAVLRRTFAPR